MDVKGDESRGFLGKCAVFLLETGIALCYTDAELNEEGYSHALH